MTVLNIQNDESSKNMLLELLEAFISFLYRHQFTFALLKNIKEIDFPDLKLTQIQVFFFFLKMHKSK